MNTHAKVRDAGVKALEDIASVMTNPEVLTLTPSILAALTDPNEKSIHDTVTLLHETDFVHDVDVAALSLLVPVLQRGLKERSTETKKKAALVVGSMCSMISDVRAIQPYILELLPVLQDVLVDPIPGVRHTAAKALGTLTRGLGEKGMPGFDALLSWMVHTSQGKVSKGESSAVERSGAAQGLVEVLVALGADRLDTVLKTEIFPKKGSKDAQTREGVLWVLVYLPLALGETHNLPYISTSLEVVLKGLADESEPVRDTAMRVGRVLVAQHAVVHPQHLISVLKAGILDPSWRIRQSSIRLLGDLFKRVIRFDTTKTKSEINPSIINKDDEVLEQNVVEDYEDADESVGESRAELAVAQAIGSTTRDELVASLYLMRNDVAAVVRQSALYVWKLIVTSTPRALRKAMPSLMELVIKGLSSEADEQRAVAGRTLGDVVMKLGHRVLPDIIPVVEAGMVSDRSEEERYSSALGLYEIVSAGQAEVLEKELEGLLRIVQMALGDEDQDVREIGGKCFNKLQSNVGGEKVVETILPPLLLGISQGDEASLQGLEQVLAFRARDVLPVLLPTLLSTPVTPSHASALPVVCQVISHILHHHLEKILLVLMEEAHGGNTCAWTAVEGIVEGMHEERSIHTLLVFLLNTVQDLKRDSPRLMALRVAKCFFELCQEDFSDLYPVCLKICVRRFSEQDPDTLQAAYDACLMLTTSQSPASLVSDISYIRNMLKTTASVDKHFRKDKKPYYLPGLSLPKGPEPILPIYLYALMHGSEDDKESAADGISELVDLVEPLKALKPYLVKMTGPLLRMVGNKFAPVTKSAILNALVKILSIGKTSLRPFLPQLQTSFVKALQDADSELVRQVGHRGLDLLVDVTPRVDPLVRDLCGGSLVAQVHVHLLRALLSVLRRRGGDVSQGILEDKVCGPVVLAALVDESSAQVRAYAALCLSVGASLVEKDFVLPSVLQDYGQGSAASRQGALLLLAGLLQNALKHAPSAEACLDLFEQASRDDTEAVRCMACRAMGAAVFVAEDFLKKGQVSQVKALLREAQEQDSSRLVKSAAAKYVQGCVDEDDVFVNV